MTFSAFSLQPSALSAKRRARIEIIPLIDVIFFLLATFVLFTLSLNKIQSLPVTLPQAQPSAPASPADDEAVVLQVSANNTAWWNRELIPLAEVRPRLDHYRATSPSPRVLVSSDDDARYGDLIHVLDHVRLSGIGQVSIETAWRAPGR
ncbi:biopolymer transporter ExbD [Opitutaceae bacterium TAV4]|uniref:ExbD/TolR family protein n=1 Tax=Geminisphaera colitermitum TaxID=1148786 RepID=UPI000158C8F2|nr:biopolymer transporter ExbD [Geminisphaera colitermitum]RRJ95056.1 biopolymer transporter ExbD [Opitutaceae bacterium TAV4]RRJ99313.1 biopolymer transporter ExbD [Opitutaceae bacterium TAV3]